MQLSAREAMLSGHTEPSVSVLSLLMVELLLHISMTHSIWPSGVCMLTMSP